MRKLRVGLIELLAAALALFLTSGNFLIVNAPAQADVIVVLAGETNWRPARGLQLLRQGYAPRMLLDVPAAGIIYDQSMLKIAQKYVQYLPEGQAVSICPIAGLSTKTEALDVIGCLKDSGAHRILVVTSDYHTRRARSIFEHEMHGYQVSIAAAFDSENFGVPWWRHRQWAKINFDEWLRLVWWEVIDRWR